jgi:hypothetical protein
MKDFDDRKAGQFDCHGCPPKVLDSPDSSVTETGFLHLFVWLHEKGRPDA